MGNDEYVPNFDCGNTDLNDFIINEASDYRRASLTVTYVMTNEQKTDDVVAFCSLANDRVSLSDFESSTNFNRYRKKQGFPQVKRMKSYPAVKYVVWLLTTAFEAKWLAQNLLTL